jgi:hypothetical protein
VKVEYEKEMKGVGKTISTYALQILNELRGCIGGNLLRTDGGWDDWDLTESMQARNAPYKWAQTRGGTNVARLESPRSSTVEVIGD